MVPAAGQTVTDALLTALHSILRKTGRCSSGAEADGGVRYHVVPPGSGWQKALCGTKPGETGNGWSTDPTDTVTCPACLKRLAKIDTQAQN